MIDDDPIVAVHPDAVEFAQPVSYTAGDVLVAGITQHTPSGMLRRVTGVSDDRRTVTTEQATLEDVFVDGTLKISGEFRQNDLSPESKQAIADAGIIDLSSNARNLSASASTPFMEFAFGFPKVAFSHGYHTVIMDGYLRFGITYNIEYDFGDATLRSAKFTITPRQETNLRMEHTSSMPKSVYKHITDGDLRTSLFPVDLSYSVSLPFPVPIVITPTFQIYVGLSQTGRVTVDITGVGSAEVGAECRSDCFKVASWDPVKQASLQYTVNEVDIQAVKVRGYIRPQFSVLLYGAFGPYAGVELFAEALREATRAHLDAGVTTYAGLSLKIPSVVDIDVTVLEGFELLRRRLWSQPTGKMYWTNWRTDKIERANLNGSGRETLISDLRDPNAIAISGGKMYWTDSSTDKIERANLDGNGRDLLISSGLRTPNAIAIAGSKMYWKDSGTGKIERAPYYYPSSTSCRRISLLH